MKDPTHRIPASPRKESVFLEKEIISKTYTNEVDDPGTRPNFLTKTANQPEKDKEGKGDGAEFGVHDGIKIRRNKKILSTTLVIK